ncbi:MAG: CDGSH iron-sulfur domain-containing protein [Actinomycetes bacterium]
MSDVTIQPKEHGPYLIRGAVKLIDAWGEEYDLGGRDVIALCRCGNSSSKPFCDGSHMILAFEAGERAGDRS